MGTVIKPVPMARVEAPPITFKDIEAAWADDPDITYARIARRLGVNVLDIMEVIDRHIEHTEKH